MPWVPGPLSWAFLIAAGLTLFQIAAPFAERLVFPKFRKMPVADTIVLAFLWTAYLSLGVVCTLFIYSFAADIISFAVQLSAFAIPGDSLDIKILTALAALTAATTIIGIFQAKMTPVVCRTNIELENLPPAFEGFTIAQISDLHASATLRAGFVNKVVNTVNSLDPDMIVVTGDLADGEPDGMRAFLQSLSALKTRHGPYYITGNHEYYWGADAWMKEAERLGLKTLANQHVVINEGGGKIVLAGVTDISSVNFQGNIVSSPGEAIKGAPADCVKILLAHQPGSYRDAEAAGFDLQLSGHTHGGQFFPFNFMIRFFHRYYKGLNRYKNLWVYVSTGAGYWGPPLRTGVRAQIPFLTLRKSA